jgi:hypothetical protein
MFEEEIEATSRGNESAATGEIPSLPLFVPQYSSGQPGLSRPLGGHFFIPKAKRPLFFTGTSLSGSKGLTLPPPR